MILRFEYYKIGDESLQHKKRERRIYYVYR